MNSEEIAYLRYIGDPGVVHTKVVVGQVREDEYMIVTPDYNIYVEKLAMHNQDLACEDHRTEGDWRDTRSTRSHRCLLRSMLGLCRLGARSWMRIWPVGA